MAHEAQLWFQPHLCMWAFHQCLFLRLPQSLPRWVGSEAATGGANASLLGWAGVKEAAAVGGACEPAWAVGVEEGAGVSEPALAGRGQGG